MTDGEMLKACPFCGGEAALGTINYSPQAAKEIGDGKQRLYHTACCIRCTAAVGSRIGYTTPAEAIAAWNTRAPTDLTNLTPASDKVAQADRDEGYARL